MTNQTAIIPFHNSALRCAEEEGTIYVAVRPICEHIGIAWQPQGQKLASDARFNCNDIVMVAEDGKNREMTCLPQHQLLGWLYTINANKVKAVSRPLLLAYQMETTDAINNYWTKGVASNPRMQELPTDPMQLLELSFAAMKQQGQDIKTLKANQHKTEEKLATIDYRFDSLPITGEQTGPIKKAVRDLAQKMGGKPHHFRQAWRTLYDRYGIAAYRDLPSNRYDEALEFVAKVAEAYGGDRLL